MSEYHIGRKSEDGRHVDLWVHLSVPATENVAGVTLGGGVNITYQDAQAARLTEENPSGFTSIAPGILAGEQTQIDNGAVFEKGFQFRFSALDLTNAQRRTEIESGNDNERGVSQMLLDIADSTSDLYKEIIEPLAWWGYYRDIP